MIWFLQGQASQRDVILGAREALPAAVQVFASHAGDRPEITGVADVGLREPQGAAESIDWVIDTAIRHGITLVVAGRNGAAYEQRRTDFSAAGLALVTGGMSPRTFELVDNKDQFTAEAERAGLACIPAITVTDAQQLEAAYQRLAAVGEVCVKPAVGIYGQGFWRFKAGAEPFRCFANPDAREVDFATYHRAYAAAQVHQPMLVMPYLPGTECSVDMVCEAGEALAWVGRRKAGVHQGFERDSAATALAIAAARHFACDGIINVQTRDDAQGRPHLLEINPRYSGGIGYTRATGINLPGVFATRRLGLAPPPGEWLEGVRVKAITVAVALPA